MTRFTTDLGRLADELPDPLAIIEADGTVSWANTATAHLLDLEAFAWAGHPLRALVHDHDRAEVDALIETGSATTVRMRDGAGRWRRLDIRSRAMPGSGPGRSDAFTMIVLRPAAAEPHLDLDALDAG